MSTGARWAVFLAILAAAGAMVAYVVRTDIDRRHTERSPGTTVAPPPIPDVDRPTSGSTVPPPDLGPPTGTSIAIELEGWVGARTGWTHKVWCEPSAEVVAGTVLDCTAVTEPSINEMADSNLLAVVLDDAGHVVVVRGRQGPYTVEALQAEQGLDCEDLLEREFPWVSALAYWLVWERPDELLEGGGDVYGVAFEVPCVATYGTETVDAALGDSLPRDPVVVAP